MTNDSNLTIQWIPIDIEKKKINQVGFYPSNDKIFVLATEYNNFLVWDIERQTCVYKDKGRARFSANGRHLVSLNYGVHVFTMADGFKQERSFPIPTAESYAAYGKFFALHPEKNIAAFSSWGRTILSIFDYINGSEIWRGHTDNAIEGGRFSPNGNFLVIHGSGVIQIWEVHGKHVFQRQSISVDNSVKDVAFFSNNEKILAILT